MSIQFGSPNIRLSAEDYQEIKEIVDSGWVCIGDKVRTLEDEFRARYNVASAIACSSATTALTIAIKAAGWKNRQVAIPAFTWPSTLYALECTEGNKPVFCDIDRHSWLMQEEIPSTTDAAIVVDTFGNEASSDYSISGDNIIYDAAHGFDLPSLGHRGIAEVVSFSFTKLVTATEGGMILTNDSELAATAYELRRLSGRMEEINALIALRSIEYYDTHYKETLERIIAEYKEGFTFPYALQHVPKYTNHSVFAVMFESQLVRDAVMVELARSNIEARVYYDPLVELDRLHNTNYVHSHAIALPTHANMQSAVHAVLRTVNHAAMRITPGKKYMEDFAQQ